MMNYKKSRGISGMAKAIIMPRLGLNEEENLLGEWFVSEGDTVKEGDPVFSIETDKSSMDVFAEEDGTVLKRFYKEYDIIPVMTPVCVIGKPGEDISDIKPSTAPEESAAENADVPEIKIEPAHTPAAPKEPKDDQSVFSPRAKVLADANGITLDDVAVSGAENRALEEDVIAAMKAPRPAAAKQAEAKAVSAPSSKPADLIFGKPVKISNFRKAISKNMMNSILSTAQTTTQMRYNASKLQKYRSWLKSSPGTEKNITINDLVMFVSVKTLQDYPQMNAHMIGDDEMIIFDNVNIGCAVDTQKGLVVPTVKNAQSMSLLEFSSSLGAIIEKCKNGTISKNEMSDATFTVSNVGSSGVTYFTPILNPPQIGILGVGTIDYAVKMTDEGILYYPAGYLSLTYDHRAIDGAPAASFLKAVCDNLENIYDIAGEKY